MAYLPVIALWVLAAVQPGGMPQQRSTPALQPRSTAQPADEHPVVVLRNHAKSVLPEDASGLYRFAESSAKAGTTLGAGIEIDEQFGDVTGYLSTQADGGKFSLQAYFFSRVEGGNGDLSFTTKSVHGVRYSFDGSITRGPGVARADDGYYLMTGALIFHDETGNVTRQRRITLKLTAQH